MDFLYGEKGAETTIHMINMDGNVGRWIRRRHHVAFYLTTIEQRRHDDRRACLPAPTPLGGCSALLSAGRQQEQQAASSIRQSNKNQPREGRRQIRHLSAASGWWMGHGHAVPRSPLLAPPHVAPPRRGVLFVVVVAPPRLDLHLALVVSRAFGTFLSTYYST
jgi:hypothetical protein